MASFREVVLDVENARFHVGNWFSTSRMRCLASETGFRRRECAVWRQKLVFDVENALLNLRPSPPIETVHQKYVQYRHRTQIRAAIHRSTL